jgi:uncharacterized protein YbjT (DUF2867 family)
MPLRHKKASMSAPDKRTAARVFVLGSTGGVGSRVADQLCSQGDLPVGLHRRPEQGEALRRRGIQPVLGDLTRLRVNELADMMAGCETVVFAAGAPDAGTRAADQVDRDGLVLATEAAAQADARRFLHISAFPDAWRDRGMGPDFEHYMLVKRQADVHLASTDLDWVIVRPGTLTSRDGTGKVRLGLAIPYGEVPREDVAAVFAKLVHATEITREILEVTTGDTPIGAALAGVGRSYKLEA